ncbi:MAG: type II secretion system protein [Candidatus Kerfeldbacteria bacterium]|nr:type II secretion system protein [Candidatus Kerfeldbacteria bacterium]
MNYHNHNQLFGFTLIELLIVIGIIAVLAALTFVGVNPMKRFKQARDTERRTASDAILNAILKYQTDNNGALPWTPADTNPRMLGTAASGCNVCAATTTPSACLDLSGNLVNEYLDGMPIDPYVGAATWTSAITGYYVQIDEIPSSLAGTSGRLTVGACEPELNANKPIKTSR